MKEIFWFIVIVTTIVYFFTGYNKPDEPKIVDTKIEVELPVNFYLLDRVIDGDTIRVFDWWESRSVRLLGFDSPESSKHRYWHTECYGAEATNELKRILSNHKEVMLEWWDGVDKYWRSLKFLYIQSWDTLFDVWAYMVENGYGDVESFSQKYKSLEIGARINKVWMRWACTVR